LLTVAGYETESKDLAGILLKNETFLRNSGGGITFSGGEPLMQADFIIDVIKYLNGLHTAVETSGYAPGNVFMKVISAVDYIMMDIKLADPEMHKKYTGADNAPIIKNLKQLQQSDKPYIIRVPLIPGITDTKENLAAISELEKENKIEYLPYNELAGAKYKMLGMKYCL
jgi:pyruvate formate lyase activating enzyme